ncbi:Androgen-dependent TFPI-regulating protein isoform X1 [Aix galericulata]|nr:Androgen-dependent TFPI-regulating protein isoform X1 [Aix galericulata]
MKPELLVAIDSVPSHLDKLVLCSGKMLWLQAVHEYLHGQAGTAMPQGKAKGKSLPKKPEELAADGIIPSSVYLTWLQSATSMEISTLTAYHCLAFVWYFFVVYSITCLRTEERPSEVFLYGGQWKYLTVLNLAVFYGVSFLADVLRLIKKLRCAKCIISSRDLLFSVLAFPVSTFVSISFWTLYTYNRELVYPKSLDGVIPLWLNHAMN